tara:strand:- start:1484 stop:1900 length:417 start_codon:yes stop_codon:yes gene_type:complete
MLDQSDVLERLRRVQELLEALRDRDAEFSERLIRHEYESAQARDLLRARVREVEGLRAPASPVSASPVSASPVPAHPPSLFGEMAANRYGQIVLLSIAAALLAWAGLPIKRWSEGLPAPAIHGDEGGDDDAHPTHEGD